MQSMGIRLVLIVLILVCGGGMYLAVDTLEAAPLKQAQTVAESRFGTDLIALCQGATQARGVLPANSKIGIINSVENTVFDIYDSAMPTTMKATDKSDVNVLLCLKEDKTVFDTSKYGKPAKYTCTQYERDLLGYLVDAKTGKTLDYKKFDGQTPPDCPDTADQDWTKTGDLPDASDIITWLTRHAKSAA
ncbi:MAG: hypothetical protein ABI947_23370 [Chloroflexota bacterium]